MTVWFARVGMPLTPQENAVIGDWLRTVTPQAPAAVTPIASWREAAEFSRVSEHDPTWWNQEEEERERLWARAAERWSESELLQRLDATTRGLEREIRAAALRAAAAAGVAHEKVADEACGMALLAAHQSALAELAGEQAPHRFILKYALFTGGRWPLGYHSARFVIF
jgi:hypothetical protein